MSGKREVSSPGDSSASTAQTARDLHRYHRQMLLPEIGEAGQRRLLASHAVLVGCGALGCTIADLLVRAGVGNLTIIDRDIVEPSNLHRQSLFDEDDAAAGRPKAIAARQRLARINSQVAIHAAAEDFNPLTAERLCFDSGSTGVSPAAGDHRGGLLPPAPRVLLDGTDNLATRYLINDLAVKHDLPFVYGGAVGTEGAAMTVRPGVTPCLRCLFPDPPPPGTLPTCDTAGVLAPVATIIAACQAADAIRILLGQADQIAPTLLRFDIWRGQRRRLDLSRGREPDCPCCGKRRFEFLEASSVDAVSLCGRNAVQVLPPREQEGDVDLPALRDRLAGTAPFTCTEHLLRGDLPETDDAGGSLALTLFRDGRAIVHGTSDLARARGIYARYVGV